ncbi:MAG TPA: tetratricopeptide repeat protein, partial [Polyangiaceae bacterium]|nr:tetratricopeptide repeat protein [Polyangiaceae bacterium]
SGSWSGSMGTADDADVFGSGPVERAAPANEPRDPSAFGEVNLGGDAGGDAGDDEFDAFPTESAAKAPVAPAGKASGGSGYGEVALEGGMDGLALGEDVERAPAPAAVAGPPPAASAQVELPRAGASLQVPVAAGGLTNKTKVTIAAALLLAVGGGALSALPDVGPYGAYWFIDTVQGESNRSALAADAQAATTAATHDTVDEVDRVFRQIDQGRQAAPRFKPRAAYAAFIAQLRRLRFGEEASLSAQANVLLEPLAEVQPEEVEYLELARTATLANERGQAELLRRGDALIARGPDFAVLVGEVAVAQRSPELALKAFAKLAQQQPGARAHFGLARAHWSAGKKEEALAEVGLALAKNPAHSGALLLRAELNLRDRAQDEALVVQLTGLTNPNPKVSLDERALALVLLGELHLSRSRVKQAEQTFGAALTLKPGSARAQRGLADTLFEAGRFGEALARYEAASKAAPQDWEAQLGMVQSMLRLERLEDAAKLLEGLTTAYPKSTPVAYWRGRAKEAIGDRDAAEKAYQAAIDQGDARPELVLAYVALTRLLGQTGRNPEADVVIAQAEKRFPNDPEVYRALGELASSRGAYDAAITQYEKALAIDPQNIGLHFARGVALRQARRFEDASAEFDAVEKIEKDFPGLELERGNLFEASGRSEEALRAYETALAQAPKDPDLMLRVGCGKAAAGQTVDARKLLEVVLEERPNSAEVNFCMGLSLLRAGKDFIEARRYLERAVGLDATRASYHLHVGMVAIELHDYSLAGKSLDQALLLDRTLADAYWQRGVLRVRQGAVKDAEIDLRRALELSPSRFEAHAALAEAYMQVNKEQDALVEWKAAVQSGHGDAFWYYRYGKLLLDNRQAEEARPQLERAVELGSKLEPPPPWLWDAHRNLALALGRTKEAIPHWEIFLDKAPKSSPYLRDALRELKAIVP